MIEAKYVVRVEVRMIHPERNTLLKITKQRDVTCKSEEDAAALFREFVDADAPAKKK